MTRNKGGSEHRVLIIERSPEAGYDISESIRCDLYNWAFSERGLGGRIYPFECALERGGCRIGHSVAY